MKYVGIKSCVQKRDALKREGKTIIVPVDFLVAGDCGRHLSVLRGNNDPYIKYQAECGKSGDQIVEKLARFRALKKSMEHGYRPEKHGYITVSENGARLDGSHRAAILYESGVKEVPVKIVRMDMTPDLENHMKDQRDAYC